MFGDRSTGEAIRSQNGKGERIPGPARGGVGRGRPPGTVKFPREKPSHPGSALTSGPARRHCALPCKGRMFENAARLGEALWMGVGERALIPSRGAPDIHARHSPRLLCWVPGRLEHL